jgi:hypothetical protein
LKKTIEGRFFKWLLQILVPGRKLGEVVAEAKREDSNLRISLLKTSTYGFRSATSVGSFALRIENGDMGAPSST